MDVEKAYSASGASACLRASGRDPCDEQNPVKDYLGEGSESGKTWNNVNVLTNAAWG